MQDTSFVVAPIACHAFFEKAEFERLFRDNFLQIFCLAAQCLDFVGIGCGGRIARKTALACLHEVLGPFVVDALRYPFAATELSNAVFPTQPNQHDPDLFFR